MPEVIQQLKLSHEGALTILDAAIAKAVDMGVPQCITIVDDGGNLLAMVRMDGAKVLSIDTSLTKARTAASDRRPTGQRPPEAEIKIALASQNQVTNLLGGLPIVVDGQTIGGIGVGSGSGQQDVEVARAGVAALKGAETFSDAA